MVSLFCPMVRRSNADLFDTGYLLLEALNQCGIVADDALLAAQDSDDPTVVISNLNLLSKCLQPLGIDVSASDIASIASEVSSLLMI